MRCATAGSSCHDDDNDDERNTYDDHDQTQPPFRAAGSSCHDDDNDDERNTNDHAIRTKVLIAVWGKATRKRSFRGAIEPRGFDKPR